VAWAIDRLGRSLSDLLDTIQHLEACGVDLYLDQQAIDTTTPMGKLVFQLTGAFAEFERTMIRQRIKAGLKRAVAQGVKLGRPTAVCMLVCALIIIGLAVTGGLQLRSASPPIAHIAAK
jgi:DNA invertase Pin-like site-specific DNA recombinase